MEPIETKQEMSCCGINLAVDGEPAPVRTLALSPTSDPVFFERRVLPWRDPTSR